MVKSAVHGPMPPSMTGTAWGSGVCARAGVISRRSRRILIARHYKGFQQGPRLGTSAPSTADASVGDEKPGIARSWLIVAELCIGSMADECCRDFSPNIAPSSLGWSSLGWSSRETQFSIEPQVLTPQHLSDVRDLPIMQSEVFHNLVNGLEPIDLVALNLKWREQIGFGQSGKDFGSLLHGSPKLLNERRGRNTTLRLKFSRSVAAVFSLVKGCNQPLANVAVQVKDHIPNTVAGFVRTPQDLFVRQSLHTGSQTRPILFQQLIAGELKEDGCRTVHTGRITVDRPKTIPNSRLAPINE